MNRHIDEMSNARHNIETWLRVGRRYYNVKGIGVGCEKSGSLSNLIFKLMFTQNEWYMVKTHKEVFFFKFNTWLCCISIIVVKKRDLRLLVNKLLRLLKIEKKVIWISNSLFGRLPIIRNAEDTVGLLLQYNRLLSTHGHFWGLCEVSIILNNCIIF